MKATPTPDTNTLLEHPECEDLPAEKCKFYPPDHMGDDEYANPGWETAWVADEGETRALANGAPVILHVWGEGHPPVNVQVGVPPEGQGQPLLNAGHAYRALGAMYTVLEERAKEDPTKLFVTAPEFVRLWEECLKESKTPPGDGASADDQPAADDDQPPAEA